MSQQESPQDESITNTSKIEFNRRNLLKLIATTTAITGGTAGSVVVTSSQVDAQIATENNLEELDMTNETIAGSLNGLHLTDSTEFTVEYENMIRGDVIELELRAQLDQINGNNPSTYDSHYDISGDGIDNPVTIGSTGVQVNSSSGEITINGSELFYGRDKINLFDVTDIDAEHIQVDLDIDSDYKRDSKIKLHLTGTAPDKTTVVDKKWDLDITIDALLGFGIFFGGQFSISA